jgi:hypothetical protein
MSDKKTWGSTVVGWFFVQEESPPGQAPDSTPSPDPASAATVPEQPAEAFFQTAPPRSVGGAVDFEAVFGAAGVDAEERERVMRAVSLLATLPPETPAPVKRQIVEASLKAFGVAIEKIIEAGVAEIQALEGYIRAEAADTQQVLADASQRIGALEQQIAELRLVMDQRVRDRDSVASTCNAKKLEVQQILEFFGQETVAQIVEHSPRLQGPSSARPGRD